MLDYTIAPLVLLLAMWATSALLALSVSPLVITFVVVGVAAVLLAILERVRPERADWVPFDQPLTIDGGHYVLNYHLGIMLGFGASFALGALLRVPPTWPSRWPFALQVVLAVFVSEGISYWQHRAAHRLPWLWRFHALHHSGARLNLVRAGRFHLVDMGTATFLTFAPLVLLGAPDAVVTSISVLSGTIGVLTHANARMRTPSWLDRLFCTPAVHRHHHSSDLGESNENFGTTVVLFDMLFGTFRTPPAAAPREVGIAGEERPKGFLAQFLGPFRARR